MTTPTHDALAASCRAFALQCKPLGVSGVLNEAADLIQQQLATIERLSAALEAIAQPVFVAEPAGTPDSPWFVALNERIAIASAALNSTSPKGGEA